MGEDGEVEMTFGMAAMPIPLWFGESMPGHSLG